MTEFLLRTFVRGYKAEGAYPMRERCGVFSSIVGIIVNVILAAMKLIAGTLSGSIAIIADALNNLSDAGSSIVTFFSFKISSKPADRDHPFGHARFEYVCSMIVSFLILLVGFELMTESISGFFDAEVGELSVSTVTFVILGASILFKLWLGIFYRKIAKLIDSSVIKASAADSFSDAVSTSAVLVSGIVIYFTDYVFVDSIVGIAVSVMIIVAGIKILNETKNSLLGEAPVDEVVESIHTIVSQYPEVLGTHDMLVHNYGPKHYIASFHAEVDGSQDIYMLHDKIDNIERQINSELGILCTIHMDPIVTSDETVNELREFTRSKVQAVFPSADIHDFRTVIGNTHTNLIFDIELPFEINDNIEVIKGNIEAEIQKEHPNCYCVITVDRK
jgi:cation diffusion facilitator family transporter